MNANFATNLLGLDLLAYNLDLAARGLVAGLFATALLTLLIKRVGSELGVAAFVVGALVALGEFSSIDNLGLVVLAMAIAWGLGLLQTRPVEVPRWPRPIRGELLIVSLFGVFVAVPDTEGPALVLGYSIPLALALILSAEGKPVGGPDRAFQSRSFYLMPSLVVISVLCRTSGTDQWVGGLCCLGIMVPIGYGPKVPKLLISDRRIILGLHATVVAIGARVVTRWDLDVAIPAAIVLLLAAGLVAEPPRDRTREIAAPTS